MIDVTIENATLEGYRAFVKPKDLDTYSQFTIKCVEEGSPCLLSHFDDKSSHVPYLSKIGELAQNDTSKVYKIPLDEPMTVTFGEAVFSAVLTEIYLQRDFEKMTNMYSFTFEKKTSEEEINKIVIPYFRAREQVQQEQPKSPRAKPKPDKMVAIKFIANFTNKDID